MTKQEKFNKIEKALGGIHAALVVCEELRTEDDFDAEYLRLIQVEVRLFARLRDVNREIMKEKLNA